MEKENTASFITMHFGQSSVEQIAQNLENFKSGNAFLDGQMAVVMVLDYIYSTHTEEQAKQLMSEYYSLADVIASVQLEKSANK